MILVTPSVSEKGARLEWWKGRI